ncbi:hypothetical protein BDV95DRAFT_558423 [Massariosphaeria phaeospora]|uniref:Uncharacterized protein n=1 Tax=Massariosphaeria phaeospora TaxID=100035 RepID=A0A7C8IDQ6_9PLEO|nr:hypothetical protein BDV95DRAFT_558423 [Massariosphaeria phaeospora]
MATAPQIFKATLSSFIHRFEESGSNLLHHASNYEIVCPTFRGSGNYVSECIFTNRPVHAIVGFYRRILR